MGEVSTRDLSVYNEKSVIGEEEREFPLAQRAAGYKKESKEEYALQF